MRNEPQHHPPLQFSGCHEVIGSCQNFEAVDAGCLASKDCPKSSGNSNVEDCLIELALSCEVSTCRADMVVQATAIAPP
jgi:hypothetical protein